MLTIFLDNIILTTILVIYIILMGFVVAFCISYFHEKFGVGWVWCYILDIILVLVLGILSYILFGGIR